MLRRNQRHSRLLDRFWAELRGNRAAAAPEPDCLAPDSAAFTRRLAQAGEQLNAPSGALDALWTRIDSEATRAELTDTTTRRAWAGPVIDRNHRRATRPVQEHEEEQIMPAITKIDEKSNQRNWTREALKIAAAVAVFAIIGLILALVLRDDDDAEVAAPSTPQATTTAAAVVPTGTRAPRPTATLPPPTPSVIPGWTDIGEIVATIPVGDGPFTIVAGEGSIWVGNGVDGTVSRIDPATNAVVATIQIAEAVTTEDVFPAAQIAIGEGAVWVAFPPRVNEADTLTRIDPATNEVVATIPLSGSVNDLVAGAGAVWISAYWDNLVLRIDPVTNTEVAQIEVGTAVGISASDNVVWVMSQRGHAWNAAQAVRIDPATNQVVAEVNVGGIGQDIQITEDGVWAASSYRFMRIDPEQNQIVAEVPFPTETAVPASIAFDGRDVWFEIFEPVSWIARVDPEINQVVAVVSYNGVGAGHTHLAYLDGSIWALTDDNAVIRIAPAP